MWNPIVAGFIGALVVHLLTRSREQEAWVRNCKKEEWRELLSALTKAEFALTGFVVAVRSEPEQSPERERLFDLYESAVADAYRVLLDRIFIHAALEKDSLSAQWEYIRSNVHSAHRTLISEDNLVTRLGEFVRLKRLMREAALNQTAPKGVWHRLLFRKD